jgi:hypothetical protein
MSDRPDFDAEAPKPEKHDVGRVFEWGGKRLEPFSAGRHMALQRLGIQTYEETGDSQMEIAAAVVRLCQMDARDVALLRGERAKQFLVELAKWMDSENIGLGNKAGRQERKQELFRVYGEIMADLYDAQAMAPEPEKGTPGGKE